MSHLHLVRQANELIRDLHRLRRLVRDNPEINVTKEQAAARRALEDLLHLGTFGIILENKAREAMLP